MLLWRSGWMRMTSATMMPMTRTTQGMLTVSPLVPACQIAIKPPKPATLPTG